MIEPLYEWSFFINNLALCAGIESITENVNGQNKQYFFMCQKGAATNEVTGIAPQYTVSGRRVYGDAAQEYVAGLKNTFGNDRKTTFKMTRIFTQDSHQYYTTVSGACTITDISDIGGATTDNVPFSFTVAFNGKPTVVTAELPTPSPGGNNGTVPTPETDEP